jgi:hypothetical protein
MIVTYLDAADAEFQNATDYYNQERAGLGFEFSDEVKETVTRIRNYPEAWTPLSKRTRRCQVHRFPYSIICEARSDAVVIVVDSASSSQPTKLAKAGRWQ